ncbi:MAG: peptide deformylase [Oscillospiraceae bacterium]|nr:peptide deformylase [Oscillospiraceae bacterium]
MSLRRIYTEGAEVLKKVSHPVTNFDRRLHILLDDMRETLKHADGVGLAAPQVGILRRIVIVSDENQKILELINPEIVSREGEQTAFEGCLSVPGRYGMVKRPMTVQVKAYNRNGVLYTATGTGITARAFCHEIDHLNGVLFTNYTDQLYTPDEVNKILGEDGKE